MHAADKQMKSPCSEISLSLSSTWHECRFKEHSLNPLVQLFDKLHSGNVYKAHPVLCQGLCHLLLIGSVSDSVSGTVPSKLIGSACVWDCVKPCVGQCARFVLWSMPGSFLMISVWVYFRFGIGSFFNICCFLVCVRSV